MVGAVFSKFKPEENELAIPTPIVSRPTDGMELVKGKKFAPFQEAKCRIEGADSLSKCADVAQVRDCNKAAISTRLGTRPKLLKRIEDTLREDVSILSLSSGLNQIKADRGKSKRIKKSLMEDIL
ncbi:hypothetical protein Ancab_034874 [Ancistrocladus abbreviatus]